MNALFWDFWVRRNIMAKDKHMKASDVFKKANYLFGGKAKFNEVFPSIDEIKVTVQELGYGVLGDGVRVLTKNDFGEYIDCSNPRCYKGGFSIGSIIRGMVIEKKTELKTECECQGYEGSPKGRKRYDDCDNFFSIHVEIKYKHNLKEKD